MATTNDDRSFFPLPFSVAVKDNQRKTKFQFYFGDSHHESASGSGPTMQAKSSSSSSVAAVASSNGNASSGNAAYSKNSNFHNTELFERRFSLIPNPNSHFAHRVKQLKTTATTKSVSSVSNNDDDDSDDVDDDNYKRKRRSKIPRAIVVSTNTLSSLSSSLTDEVATFREEAKQSNIIYDDDNNVIRDKQHDHYHHQEQNEKQINSSNIVCCVENENEKVEEAKVGIKIVLLDNGIISSNHHFESGDGIGQTQTHASPVSLIPSEYVQLERKLKKLKDIRSSRISSPYHRSNNVVECIKLEELQQQEKGNSDSLQRNQRFASLEITNIVEADNGDDDDESTSMETISVVQSTGMSAENDQQEQQQRIPAIPAIILMENICSFVSERLVWNAISTLNKECYAISKSLLHLYRPWPNKIRWRAITTQCSISSSSSNKPNNATTASMAATRDNTEGPTVALMEEQQLFQQQQRRHRRRRIARGVKVSARPWTVAFGLDYLCCGTDQGDVLVWKVHENGSMRSLRGHSGRVNSVRCYKEWLISAGDDRSTRIWNVTTMSCESILTGHAGSITSVAVLPFRHTRFLRRRRRRDDDDLKRHDSSSFEFPNPDNTASTGATVLPSSSSPLRTSASASSSSSSNTFYECMLVATASMDCDVRLYAAHYDGSQIVSTEYLTTFAPESRQESPVHSIVMYKTNDHRHRHYLISGGMDGRLRLWDIDSFISSTVTSGSTASRPITYANKCILRYDGEIKSIVVSRDKRRIAVAVGRTVCYATIPQNDLFYHRPHQQDYYYHHHQPRRSRRQQHQQNNNIATINQLIVAAENETNNENDDDNNNANDDDADISSGDEIDCNEWRVLKGHSGDIRSIDFSSDGKCIASACIDGSIRLWELGEGTWKRKWKAHNGFMVCSLAVSPDGQCLLSAGSDGTIAIENLTWL